jgi:hypothetical protein
LLAIASMEFEFEVLDELYIKGGLGTLWHSVLGLALKDQGCIKGDLPCSECELFKLCDYTALFKKLVQEDGTIIKAKQTVSPPHVFVADRLGERSLKRGESFSVKLNIIGTAISRASSLIRAMQQAGISGLGNRHRSCLHLLSVTLGSVTCPQSKSKIWQQGDRFDVQSMMPEIERLEVPPMPANVQLAFVSPYIPKAAPSGEIKTFDLAYFMRALMRNVSIALEVYTDEGQPAQAMGHYRQLAEDSRQLEVLDNNVSWQATKTYSLAKQRLNDVSGWVGTIRLGPDNAQGLWPYLWLGQWLGNGKMRSQGFGQYVLF